MVAQGDGVLLAVESGRFSLLAPGRPPQDLTLAEVLHQVAVGQPPRIVEPPPRRPTLIPADLQGVVIHAAQTALVLAAGGRACAYDDERRCWTILGPDHLRILALGPDPADRAAIVAAVEGDDVPAHLALADLEGLGLIRVAVHAGSPAGREAPPASEAPASDDGSVFGNADRLAARSSVLADGPDPARAGQPPIRPGTVPVISFWATDDGPPMGSAAVVAYARVWEGGRLAERYDLRLMDTAAAAIADAGAHDGPVILLCGNYDWSLEANLEVAAAARAANPLVVTVHGGPSTPSGVADGEPFLRRVEGIHVAVAGEGEVTFVELLDALRFGPDGRADLSGLVGLDGIRFLDPDTGAYVAGEPRARHATLEDFPSPLVGGELDLVPTEALNIIAIETNRGCPYSCTFCDWGSATMSRIRQFPMERVRAEMAWLADRGIEVWYVADANFGIVARDVEIAEMIGDFRRASGVPKLLIAFPAKNSTERYLEIMDALIRARIAMKAALAFQTRDADTLKAVRRSNIKTSAYDHLAAESRRRGLPLLTELMVGLPGATVAGFKEDLQWGIDRQVRAFLYPTVVLPNAPMNAPEYREALQIRTIDGRIVSTSSFSEADRDRMDRLADAFHAFEVFGSLRHVLRHLQWDHGRRAIDVIEQVMDILTEAPDRYPLLAGHLGHFGDLLLPPVGWDPFFDEVARLLQDELGLELDGPMQTAIAVTRHALIWPGRRLPASIELDHDYVAYFRSAQRSLLESGEPGVPDAPLAAYGRGTLEVSGDPLDVAALLGRWEDGDPFQQALDYELRSPLAAYRTSIGDDHAVDAVVPSGRG